MNITDSKLSASEEEWLKQKLSHVYEAIEWVKEKEDFISQAPDF